jgi:DNA-binding HxlR family transcriptional regulator
MLGYMSVNGAARDPRTCDRGLARAFALLGKRWNGVLIGTLGNGQAGFAELARAIPGISESVLSDRLNELVRLGVISRTVREGPPLRVSYQLTPRGEALAPVLCDLTRWANENLPEERDPRGATREEPC